MVEKLHDLVLTNIKQLNSPIELDENQKQVMTQNEKAKLNERSRKVIIYSLKCFQEILGKFELA